MTGIKELSVAARPELPDAWYEITADDHFWIEWRFRAFLRQLDALSVSREASWRGLDVGCGHGVVRRQLESATAWAIDGADLNREALSQNRAGRGETFFYDVHDRRPELAGRYDFAVVFDVLEHVDRPTPFLEAVSYHLKPGAWLFCNVPALQAMYSDYDRTVGHQRRYDRRSLRADAEAAGLRVRDLRYWGFAMLPYLALRKLMRRRGASAGRVVERGLQPPAPWLEPGIRAVMGLELAWLARPVVGTSLLMAAARA